MYLFKLLVLQIIPRPQNITLDSSLVQPCRYQLLQFFAGFRLDFVLKPFVQKLKEVLEVDDTLQVQTEYFDEGRPVSLCLELLLQIDEGLQLRLG